MKQYEDYMCFAPMTDGEEIRDSFEEEKKYKVEFEFMYVDADVSDGKWHKDTLDNNGAGFTLEDAERVACELRASTIQDTKWAEVVEIKD